MSWSSATRAATAIFASKYTAIQADEDQDTMTASTALPVMSLPRWPDGVEGDLVLGTLPIVAELLGHLLDQVAVTGQVAGAWTSMLVLPV